jgi:hypothetical protein
MDDEGFRELYEMKQDPWQLTNEAYSNVSSHVAVVEAMANRLSVLRSCAGPSCRKLPAASAATVINTLHAKSQP